jgi:hypothetical protein
MKDIRAPMRIDPRIPVSPVTGAAQPARTGGSARFSLGDAADAKRAAGPSASMPTGGLDGLLALQAAGDALERKRRAVRRGRDLLDHLDQVKVALLSGRVPVERLMLIRAVLASRRDLGDDPALEELLAQIDLRAEVELAKLGR